MYYYIQSCEGILDNDPKPMTIILQLIREKKDKMYTL